MPKRIDKKNSRTYYIEEINESYPSVTTITGLLDKPALRAWYAKTAAEYLRSLALEAVANPAIDALDFLKGLTTDNIIRKAKSQPTKIKEEAAEKGKRVHKVIEMYFKTGMVEFGDDLKPQITKFFEWRYKYRLHPIASEHIVYSQKYKYAGTLDLVAEIMDEKKFPFPYPCVIDFKTSNGIWPEHKLQLAAYVEAYKEMTNKPVFGAGILRIDKATGETEWHEYSLGEMDSYFEEFRHLCKIWHIRKARKEKK